MVNEEEVKDLVREVMAGMFSLPPEDIGDHSSLETVEKWDSLGHVNLMMALQQAFGISIDIEQAIEMTSFPLVWRAIKQRLGESP